MHHIAHWLLVHAVIGFGLTMIKLRDRVGMRIRQQSMQSLAVIQDMIF